MDFISNSFNYVYNLFFKEEQQTFAPKYNYNPSEDEIDSFIENVKYEMKVENDIKILENRFNKLIQGKSISYINQNQDDDDQDDDDKNDNNQNNDGALKIRKKISLLSS